VFEAFPQLIPAKPYCNDYHGEGLVIRSRSKALTFRHVQLNGPMAYAWMTFDIDRDDAYRAADDAGLKAPTVLSINPKNGHGHLSYLLKTPVSRFAASRRKPLEYYAGVERGYRRRLDADRGYSGLIVKNPLHPDWRTDWQALKPYTLEDLDCELAFDDKAPEILRDCELGAGRNVTVFDELRFLAYREVRAFKPTCNLDGFKRRVLDLGFGLNLQFAKPMTGNEVGGISKSIAKWTWKHFSVEGFVARQTHLSKLGHSKRYAGVITAKASKPWDALGVSRSTYYRRKARQPSAI